MVYQVSESCEDSSIASEYQGYPWCSDILDHINLTFVGVMALFLGLVVIALGGRLHWLLEKGSPTSGAASPPEVSSSSQV